MCVMKVRYNGCTDIQVTYGDHDDPRGVLEKGSIYEVEYQRVRAWTTDFKLTGIDGRFNSTCFEKVGVLADTQESG